MSKKPDIYIIDDATGSVTELYAWIMAGVTHPPSIDTFRSRLRRGERRAEELQRPPDHLSDRGCAARREGARRYHEQRRAAAHLACADPNLAGVHDQELPPIASASGMKTAPTLPAAVLETLHCRRPLPETQEWTGWKPAYIRPGALDAWPGLKQTLERK